MATLTESFDQADSDVLGPDLTWTEIQGDIDVVSNRAQGGAFSQTHAARADHDLETDDHYAQAAIYGSGNTLAGVMVRKDSTATLTCYTGEWDGGFDRWEINKFVDGTQTQLATGAGPASVAGDIVRLEANGIDLELFVNGVSTLAVSDASIHSNLRAGIWGQSGAAVKVEWDNFVTGDIQRTPPYTESFDQPDSTTLGPDLTWTEVLGDWQTVNNEATSPAKTEQHDTIRAEHDLSSVDHYAEAQTYAENTGLSDPLTSGPRVRFSATDYTTYSSGINLRAGDLRTFKHVAGTPTLLASVAFVSTRGTVYTQRTEAEGSTIRCLIDGVERLSVTDTSITGNTRTGVGWFTGSISHDTDRWMFQSFAAGDLPLAPPYSETFDKQDSDLLGPVLDWTEVKSDWDVVNNEAASTRETSTHCSARAEHDLFNADHYAQAVQYSSSTFGGTNNVGAGTGSASTGGPRVRFSPTEETYYVCGIEANGDAVKVEKMVAGSPTTLASISKTINDDTVYTVRGEAEGSTIRTLVDGIEEVSVTDGSITGNLRTGIGYYDHSTSSDRYPWLFQSFEAGDLAAAGGFGAPQNVTATPVSASQIDLGWDAVDGASGYDVERDGVVIVTDHGLTTFSDTGLDPATQYNYRVRAVKA